MPSRELENLVTIGSLDRLQPTPDEIEALTVSGRVRLLDARNESLNLVSRFDLTYNAAHAFALAALRSAGYRSKNRITVFQCLEHTTNLPAAERKLLVSAHKLRNEMEYEAEGEVDAAFLQSLIAATASLGARV